jgi:hypothetical protein
VLSEPADAVPAGKYAMSNRQHMLSDLCDEMPGWPDLLSTAVYTVPASRYAMSILYDELSVFAYAMPECVYAVSACVYVVSDVADAVSAWWNRYVVSIPSYEVSGV